MSVAVLGATGRLGRIVRRNWGEDAAIYLGRHARGAVLDRCEVIIDLRGIVPGQGCVSQNIDIARDALDLGLRIGARRVFLPSSAAVYGRLAGSLSEEQARPVSDYGRAKAHMEKMADTHEQPSTVLRIGNVAGADAILGGWRPGFKLDQWPDGHTPKRSYIGPIQFARSLSDLVQVSDLPAVLNVAAPGAVAMGDLLDQAGLAWSGQCPPVTTIPRVELDTKRLLRHTRMPPRAGTAEGIVEEWRQMKAMP